MKRLAHLTALSTSLALVGCALGPDLSDDGGLGAGGGVAVSDAGAGGGTGIDAGALADAGADVSMYPAWALTDLQPQSPRFNTSYGLSVFAGRPVAVVLLEGF